MGILAKFVLLGVLGTAIFLGVKLNDLLFGTAPIPVLEDVWWGPGEETKVDPSVKPFEIRVSEKVLIDLKERLRRAQSITPSLEGVQQQYGINSNLLTEIINFWRERYDWRQRERYLNQYPQFTTNIQGLDIHFLHVKPSKGNSAGLRVLPLLMLHGWPGSVREFYDVIPLMTTPKKGVDFVFELIIPSLPGYGFSTGASKPGLHVGHIANIFKNLMSRLAFDKYYVQGGDWGASIAQGMASFYPDKVLGLHSNMCHVDSPMAFLKIILGSLYPRAIIHEKQESRLYPMVPVIEKLMTELGYMHLQATKPDTVGVALNDSPVGLAAYILEKFTYWTNSDWINRLDGGLKERFSYVDLLDNVMIYWVTNSITTAMRLYAETLNKDTAALGVATIPVNIPSACSKYRHEVLYQPDSILSLKFKNIVHSRDVEDGGHFAAFEMPKVFADDVWVAIEKIDAYRNLTIAR